jgi:YD repeat-containing protein
MEICTIMTNMKKRVVNLDSNSAVSIRGRFASIIIGTRLFFVSIAWMISCLLLCHVNSAYGQISDIPIPNYVEDTAFDIDNNGAMVISRKYSDGQGRGLQSQVTVKLNDGATINDLVSATEYDCVGRKIKVSKPVSLSRTIDHLALNYVQDDIFNIANSYYKNRSGGNDSAYSSIDYWADPLGRPRKSGSMGKNFTATVKPVKTWYFGITGTQAPATKFGADGFILPECLTPSQYSNELETFIPGELALLDDSSINFRLIVTMDQQGNFSQEIQDAFGKTLGKKGPVNDMSKLSYDILGRIVSETPPQVSGKEVPASTYTYYSTGQVETKTTPDGGKTYYFYDDAGRLVETFDANDLSGITNAAPTDAMNRTTNKYDDLGRMVRVTTGTKSAQSTRVRTIYDDPDAVRLYLANTSFLPAGDPTAEAKLTDLLNSLENTRGRAVAIIAYDEDFSGSDSQELSYAGKVVDLFSYDDEGRVACKYKAIPGLPLQTAKFCYGLQGKLMSDTILFNATGKVITLYKYDLNGRLSEIHRNDSKYAAYEYDTLGRTTKKTFYGLGSTDNPEQLRTVSFAYNISDWITSIQTGDGSFYEKLCYDENTIDALDSVGGFTRQFNGNISRAVSHTSLPVPEAGIPDFDLLYTYDGANRLTNVVNRNTSYSPHAEYDSRFSYLADGRILEKHEGTDQDKWKEYAYYSATNRLAGIANSPKKGSATDETTPPNYIYDYNGNMVLDRSKKMMVTYDWRDLPVAFSFYSDVPSTVKTCTDLKAGFKASLISKVVMVYDAAGSRVSKETLEYVQPNYKTWEPVLVITDTKNDNTITITSDGSILVGQPINKMSKVSAGALLIQHGSDPLIAFSSKGVHFDGVVRTKSGTEPMIGDMTLFVTPSGNSVLSVSKDGVHLTIAGSLPDLVPDNGVKYVDGSHVFDRSGTEGYKLSYVNADDGMTRHPDASAGNSSFEYFIKDHLGSTRAVLYRNSAGGAWSTQEAMAYFAYGTRKSIQTPSNADMKARRSFTGKEVDEDGAVYASDGVTKKACGMGLEYFGKRYFDPEVGLFTSIDPMDQFWNSYRFTVNPISHIDPDGMADIKSVENDSKGQSANLYEATYTVYKDGAFDIMDNYIYSPEYKEELLGSMIIGSYSGSTIPDDIANKPTIVEGTYPYRQQKMATSQRDAFILNKGEFIPTKEINPLHGKAVANGVFIHKGYNSERGSEACQTIKPSDWESFYEAAGQTGRYRVTRR